jgi:hypothetical protein
VFILNKAQSTTLAIKAKLNLLGQGVKRLTKSIMTVIFSQKGPFLSFYANHTKRRVWIKGFAFPGSTAFRGICVGQPDLKISTYP